MAVCDGFLALADEWISRAANEDAVSWFRDTIERIRHASDGDKLAMAIGFAPRRLGKADLPLTSEDKARANAKIAWLLDTEVDEIQDGGKGEVTGMVVRNRKTGERTVLPVSGVFVAIGHTPNTSLFRGQLEMDANGYLITHAAFLMAHPWRGTSG